MLAGIKGDSFYKMSEEELMDYVRNLMLKYRLIDNEHEMKNIKSHVFPTYYIGAEARIQINSLDPRITLIHSTDLIYGMQYILQEDGAK